MRAIRYAFVPSPFGDLLAVSTREGLARLAYPDEDPDGVLAHAEDALEAPAAEAPAAGLARDLDAYFAGRRHSFATPIDLALAAPGFATGVLEATARIPYGEVATYGDVAAMAGSPRAARAAGNALNRNPVPIVVPCHRVIPASGGLGGYGGHEERKDFLLRLEGVLRP